MNKRIIALLAVSIFATGAVTAGTAGTSDKQFKEMDQNGDGKISKEEANESLQQQWSAADANSDGAVDKSEFSAFESVKGSEPAQGADQPAPGSN